MARCRPSPVGAAAPSPASPRRSSTPRRSKCTSSTRRRAAVAAARRRHRPSDAHADQWPARASARQRRWRRRSPGRATRHFLFASVTVTDADTAQAAEQIARDAITADDDVVDAAGFRRLLEEGKMLTPGRWRHWSRLPTKPPPTPPRRRSAAGGGDARGGGGGRGRRRRRRPWSPCASATTTRLAARVGPRPPPRDPPTARCRAAAAEDLGHRRHRHRRPECDGAGRRLRPERDGGGAAPSDWRVRGLSASGTDGSAALAVIEVAGRRSASTPTRCTSLRSSQSGADRCCCLRSCSRLPASAPPSCACSPTRRRRCTASSRTTPSPPASSPRIAARRRLRVLFWRTDATTGRLELAAGAADDASADEGAPAAPSAAPPPPRPR